MNYFESQKFQDTIKGAEKLAIKLRQSPKNNTYENYGQKEITKFIDSIKDYSAQGAALEVFAKYNF